MSTRLFHHQCECHRWKDDTVSPGRLGPCDPSGAYVEGFRGWQAAGWGGHRRKKAKRGRVQSAARGRVGKTA